MIQPEEQKKKRGILDRLPKLGRVSQLILVVGIFLLIFIPIYLVYQQQPAKQASLGATLVNLRRITSAEQTPKTNFEVELAQVTAENEANKAAFFRSDRGPEILDRLLQLARDNDIYVTESSLSLTTPTGAIGPLLTVKLALKGQVPKFQNFLLELDKEFQTAQISQVSFAIAQTKEAEDTARVTINIACYDGNG